MADFFVDHGAYSTTLGATPTWGVPQEGDGSSKFAAVSSAVAAIVLNGQPAANDTVIICGLTFTAIAGVPTAGTATFQIGANVQATANNLAAAINGCTVTTISTLLVNNTPQFRNVLFARSTATNAGTAANTIEIMTRIGSQRFNYNASTNQIPAITSSAWGAGSPTVTQFAGGTGGCFGLAYNIAAIGVASSIAVGAYGMMASAQAYKPLICCSSADPAVAALPTLNDTIHLRSKSSVRINVTSGATGPGLNKTYPENWLLDSNLVWTGDDGLGTFTISLNGAGQSASIAFGCSGVTKSFTARALHALRFVGRADHSGGGSVAFGVTSGGNNSVNSFTGVLFGEDGIISYSNTTNVNVQMGLGGGYTTATFRQCKFSYPSPRTNSFSSNVALQGSLTGVVLYEDCSFEYNFIGVADPGAIAGFTYNGNASVRFYNCRFTGAPAAFPKFRLAVSSTEMGNGELVFDNCTGIKLDTYIGFQKKRSDTNTNLPYCYFLSADTGRAFRYETTLGCVDWNPEATVAYPLLVAKQPDGTPWSMKLDWLAFAVDGIHDYAPFGTRKLSLMYRLPSAVRTITLEFFARTTLAIDSVNTAMRVSYIDSSGILRAETTRRDESAIQTSSAAWLNASGWPSHSAKKIVLTTAYPVKQNTEVSVIFEFYRISPSGTAEQVFVDVEYAMV